MSINKDEIRSPEFYQKLPIITNAPKTAKEEDYLREIKYYEFINLEEPGVGNAFTYQGHNIRLFHGGKYHFPRFLARHIESRAIPQYKYIPSGTGEMIPTKVGENPRFQMRELYEAPEVTKPSKKKAA